MRKWKPEEIKAFRKKLNLYQKDLASLLGVSERYIIYLEKGVKKPGKSLRFFMDCVEKQFKEKKRYK